MSIAKFMRNVLIAMIALVIANAYNASAQFNAPESNIYYSGNTPVARMLINFLPGSPNFFVSCHVVGENIFILSDQDVDVEQVFKTWKKKTLYAPSKTWLIFYNPQKNDPIPHQVLGNVFSGFVKINREVYFVNQQNHNN